MSAPNSSLYKRITASVPLLVTVIVHVILIGVAGYFVSEQIISKKKTFEAPPPSDASVAQKQVEHRLQVARKGGGSASSSPVSASRIFSTAENALQMPAMPDLPQVGASSLAGMGFGKGMGGMGAGTGMNTGLGNGSGTGSGFMTLSFLGTTTQRASKIVFALDVESGLMDVRKGGYGAFKVIREQMMKLVGALPPGAEFNVVVFEHQGSKSNVMQFAPALLPATFDNKSRFGQWIAAINGNPAGPFGIGTAANAVAPNWTLPSSVKLDPEYHASYWLSGLHAALTQRPDTIYLITGSGDLGRMGGADAALWERKQKEFKEAVEEQRAALKRMGLDLDAVIAARKAAYDKARREFDEMNNRLIAEKKDPFVIKDIRRVFEPDFQKELRRRGQKIIKLDTTGWTDKQGNPITPVEWRGAGGWTRADVKDAASFISRLQSGYLPTSATINLFYFAGPDDKGEGPSDSFSTLARRNNGRFQLITAKRLEEIAREDQKQ